MNLTKETCFGLLYDGHDSTPDADISGTGVVLAFLLSAYITIAVVCATYVCGLVEDDLLNDIDRRIFHIRAYRCTRPTLFIALRKTVLIYGDQQIVTGIAIMAAGFQGLRTGEITVYHYQIVLYLAWMASSVHLSALTVLGNSLSNSKGLMAWRLTGMLVLLVLLVVGLVPTASNLWAGSGLNQPWSSYTKRGWGVPAKCFWEFQYLENVNPDAPLGYLILVVSYLWKIGGLFASTRRLFNRWCRFPLEQGIVFAWRFPARQFRKKRSWIWLQVFRLQIAILLPLMAVLEMLASFLASLWLSTLGLVFGTIQVMIPRSQNEQFTGPAENHWGFGQLVPLILLVQPLGILIEHIVPSREDKEDIQAHYGPNSPMAQALSPVPRARRSKRALMSCIRTVAPATEEQRIVERAEIKAVLYSSRVFAMLVILIQFTIILTAIFVFKADASTIGNDSLPNWPVVSYSIVGMYGLSVVLGIIASPFTGLGRAPTESWNGDTSSNNDVQWDMSINTLAAPSTSEKHSTPQSPATAEMNPPG